ncbi:hypothetical protein K466DRAFT_604648 [Polyporus arcularius HHB13444]|uniref:Uncharacterized protein n=1 Tax=Polyporus arcularius HHB13444 TaxID=1314778 RepID=A0A5C3NVC2_9APHY|nr:hypothetical protein K466DRAFT_604648 [Polyporus arcularius HHB13444]
MYSTSCKLVYRDVSRLPQLVQVQAFVFKEQARGKKNLCAKCSAPTKKGKLRPPPELADKEAEIRIVGREYSFLVSPWPPTQAFALEMLPDDINPDNYEQRYPKFCDSELALLTAHAKELQEFVPAVFHQYFRNLWFKSVVSGSINSHKGHMVFNCKDNRHLIFAHIPDVDTRMEFWHGNDEFLPRILYPHGDTSDKRLLFRTQALLNVLRICAYGKGALKKGHVPRSNTTAKLWGIEESSFGMIATGIVIVTALPFLSGLPEFLPETWQGHHESYVKFLMHKRDTPAIVRLLAWFDYRLFSVAGRAGSDLPLERAPQDDWENGDWSALELDWDDDVVSELRPVPGGQLPVETVSAIFTAARADAITRAITEAWTRPATDRDDDSEVDTPSTVEASPNVTPPALSVQPVFGDIEPFESILIALSRARTSLLVPVGHCAPITSTPAAAAHVPIGPPSLPTVSGFRSRGRNTPAPSVAIAGPSQPVAPAPAPAPVALAHAPGKPRPRPLGRADKATKDTGKGKAPAVAENEEGEQPGRVLRRRNMKVR